MAQNNKEVGLGEVVVKGSRIVNTAGGQQIYPTAKQLENSTSGYSLLSKLTLPDIHVDEVMHTISASGNLGEVQVRINDIIATKQDLLSLDMKSVKYVEYIKNPGVRYGQDVAFVINFITKRANNGYIIGTDITQTLTTINGDYSIYGKWNKGKSEFDLDYNFAHHCFKGSRNEDEYKYILSDNSTYTKLIKDVYNKERECMNYFRLRYNLADSNLYVLQVTLSGNLDNSPSNKEDRELMVNGEKSCTSKFVHDRNSSPALDLYYNMRLDRHQIITANAVGTYIDSKYAYSYRELVKDYHYQAIGESYSFTSEAIYENKLKPFTFSGGIQYLQKYMENKYSGDVNQTTKDHTSNVYLYTQIKGNLSPLYYMVGMGVSRRGYSQSENSYNYWLLCPKLSLSMPVLKKANIKYSFSLSPKPPRVELLSGVAIRTDEMTINAGNPNLRSTKRIEQNFNVSYQTPRLYSHINAFYRINIHPNLQKICRENDIFVFTQANQPKCNELYIANNTRYDVLPDKLTITLDGGVLRCFNYGDDYRHFYTSFNGSIQIVAYLGKFTLHAYADNGWNFLEGESEGHEGAAYYASASYKFGNVEVSLFMQHLFQKNPKTWESELRNCYVYHSCISRNGDYGNMISLNFSWSLSHGRKYTDIQRNIENRDKDTGILK